MSELPELYIAVHWYFMRFLGKSPFGATGSGVDLRSYWMGMQDTEWVATHKGTIKRTLGLVGVKHTHHAGEDAAELAQVFEAVLAHRRKREADQSESGGRSS